MSDLAIVESRADRASVHICDELRDLVDWTERTDDGRPDADGGGTYYRTDRMELRSFDDFHLDLERPDSAFECDPDLLAFASRHSGDTGALLTGHFTGNFGPAEFGGDTNAVATACPNALVRLLETFDEHAPDGYDVGMECTHHGPTDVGCPSLFAELGSGDEQWDDPAGSRAVARAILKLRGVAPHRGRQVVGFGGNHYAPRFERIVRETPWAVGHVAADWALEAMDHPRTHEDLIEAAFEASNAEFALLDGEWPVLETTLEKLGYDVVSETWLREVGDRPLTLVATVETDLGTIDSGVRFGVRRETPVVVIDLPTELVEAAEGIDPDEVRGVIERNSIAFTTDNGGSRIGDRAAVPGTGSRDDVTNTDDAVDDGRGDDRTPRVAIVEELAAVLEEKYESVAITGDAVVVERRAFDPGLAREAGVPEGPKFGTLADGESVTVDGDTIEPERVWVRRTRTFAI
ncbi:hypothetical protein EA462_05790 [Natrarchaeobius halalkaliphilus]|uniref:D-aminoacyl-tRNA deacylase n=1 Tax=Natrarchaeobius halalkaliphilus TaxID=1679091 RepID=A0A3N6LPQ3_9EURY|nr:D-aminoacyl-tRNA deacylase [Natrarchaeobius halalkaliphilus]RQG91473.1 hypothetical protein EA462_05790 [Natrarchaeobius halalkaliphilus]